MRENGNAPAHPVPATNGGRGLTKREAFALAAMQGLLAAAGFAGDEQDFIAKRAVRLADALLAALEPTP